MLVGQGCQLKVAMVGGKVYLLCGNIWFIRIGAVWIAEIEEN